MTFSDCNCRIIRTDLYFSQTGSYTINLKTDIIPRREVDARPRTLLKFGFVSDKVVFTKLGYVDRLSPSIEMKDVPV